MTNRAIVDRLRAYAAELCARGGNLYRVRAVRRAAGAVGSLPEELETVVAQAGEAGVSAKTGVGKELAKKIADYTRTGEWRKN